MNERLSRVEFVRQKYRLAELVFIDAESGAKRLGHGRVMAEETFQLFVDSDPSGTGKYLDWMLFQAGGGHEAMEKSIGLWKGDALTDPHAIRNECHRDYVVEQIAGYTDEHGLAHAPVSAQEAERNWLEFEERCQFEFLMGDQDIALEDGFGFFRHWPGKSGLYERIVNVVTLWHNSQQRLSQENQRIRRAANLRNTPSAQWNHDDRLFMAHLSVPLPEPIELDIYKGWKLREYSQAKAHYRTIDLLIHPLADIRKNLILKDERFDLIYEDLILRAICPLTVGAGLRYGCNKWCLSNRTDFEKSLDPRAGSNFHWKTYAEKGPCVFLLFKIPMPAYCHKLALSFNRGELSSIDKSGVARTSWYDAKNEPSGLTHNILLQRIQDEHKVQPLLGQCEEDRRLAYAGRAPGRAWNDSVTSHQVQASISKATEAIAAWARKFDCSRIVIDYMTAAESAQTVSKSG